MRLASIAVLAVVSVLALILHHHTEVCPPENFACVGLRRADLLHGIVWRWTLSFSRQRMSTFV